MCERVTNVCQYFAPKSKSNRKDSKRNAIELDFKPKELLLEMFDKIDSQISGVRDDVFSPLMQSLFQFVSNNCLTNQMREKSFQTKFTANTGLIPTALLSIGLNSSEQNSICDQLIETIQDLTSYVVYFNSSQTQNISSVFKTFFDSILTEDLIESHGLSESQIKRMTFATLFKLYEEYVINKNSNNFCPPIVIFFDEIESFDHKLITTLILIIKEYMQTIPFILIVSKCNETTCLQHLLPSCATDFLIIYHFSAISANGVIDQMINDLLIESSLSLKFGPNVLDFMIKMFKKFDYSLQNIEYLIKFSLFQHFYANELSFLCQSKAKLKKYLQKMSLNELKVLTDSSLFDSSLTGKEFNKSVVKKISEFNEIHNQFVITLKILLKFLNQSNKNIDLLQLYVKVLNKSFDFEAILESLNRLSQNQWKRSFENCFTESSLNVETVQTLPLIKLLKTRQKDLIEILNVSQMEPQVLIEKVEISDIKSKLSNLKSRMEWKESINPLNTPKVLSKFDLWKKTTVDLIGNVLNQTVNPMTSSLSEVMFFDNLDSLKEHIFVVLRNDFQKSLNNHLVISNKNKAFDAMTDCKHFETDFHKLFVLYNESQSLINMFDWFSQFKTSNTQSEPLAKCRKRSKTDNSNDERIVRFLNTVSDFEYIGLIQSCKRKSDHLMRLVWF